MITTYLIAHPWLTTAALVALVTLGPVIGFLLADQPRIAAAVGAFSLLPVMALTLVPLGNNPVAGCAVEWTLPRVGAVELVANVVLFVPPVLAWGVATRRPLRVAMAGSLLSVLIETTQAFIPALGRSCSTNDWLCNSLGAVLGAVLAAAALAAHHRRSGTRRS